MSHTLPTGGVLPLPAINYDELSEKGAIANALRIIAAWLRPAVDARPSTNHPSTPRRKDQTFDAMRACFAGGESWQDAMDHPAADAVAAAAATNGETIVTSTNTESSQ